jgi:hypothetical protein
MGQAPKSAWYVTQFTEAPLAEPRSENLWNLPKKQPKLTEIVLLFHATKILEFATKVGEMKCLCSSAQRKFLEFADKSNQN